MCVGVGGGGGGIYQVIINKKKKKKNFINQVIGFDFWGIWNDYINFSLISEVKLQN